MVPDTRMPTSRGWLTTVKNSREIKADIRHKKTEDIMKEIMNHRGAFLLIEQIHRQRTVPVFELL